MAIATSRSTAMVGSMTCHQTIEETYHGPEKPSLACSKLAGLDKPAARRLALPLAVAVAVRGHQPGRLGSGVGDWRRALRGGAPEPVYLSCCRRGHRSHLRPVSDHLALGARLRERYNGGRQCGDRRGACLSPLPLGDLGRPP